MYLFQLASQHMAWLGQRQSVIATNIANADRPGYQARTLRDFSTALDAAAPVLARTAPGHLEVDAGMAASSDLASAEVWDQSHSGNTVSVERELIESAQSARMMSVDSAVTRSFHRMMLMSLKV